MLVLAGLGPGATPSPSGSAAASVGSAASGSRRCAPAAYVNLRFPPPGAIPASANAGLSRSLLALGGVPAASAALAASGYLFHAFVGDPQHYSRGDGAWTAKTVACDAVAQHWEPGPVQLTMQDLTQALERLVFGGGGGGGPRQRCDFQLNSRAGRTGRPHVFPLTRPGVAAAAVADPAHSAAAAGGAGGPPGGIGDGEEEAEEAVGGGVGCGSAQ